jgi:tripartite-type tricarboxylate transporter receptor subunit TctC
MFATARSSLAAALAMLALASDTLAQAIERFPQRPIRVVVGYTAGGPLDIVVRPVGQKLSELLGQPVVIDNRPGANGNIGAAAVVKASPDGYTLLLASKSQLTNNPSLYQPMPFDALKDLQPLSLIAVSPAVLVVHPGVPAVSLQELIALAKAQPERLRFSSAGNGSANHLAAELFKLLARVNMTHVPYRGGAQTLSAVVAGEVELTIISLPTTLPFIKAGRLRALALCANQRAAVLPQLPTSAEGGLPGLESSSGSGLLAPARTPRDIVRLLHAETVRAVTSPDVRERLLAQGLDIVASTPDEFAAVLREETARWAKVIKAARIKAD